MLKTFLILGSINAFLSVALGAFGAHGYAKEGALEIIKVLRDFDRLLTLAEVVN